MRTPRGRQLTLGVALREGHDFANFVAGRNQPAIAALRRLAGGASGPLVYLWGAAGSGKTHLLEAACAEAAGGGRATAYVPLSSHAELHPAMLAGLDSARLICIDDVDAIAGRTLWEEALFHLYNQAECGGVPMAVAAHRPPLAIPLALNDLKSRLSSGTVFQTRELNDSERGRVLAARATARGLEFPEEAVRYLMSRGPRDMHSLMAVLDRLDAISLSEQRRLTVPLVREVLLGEGVRGR
ncbi:MAG TPA: DnaA regulatory inactivator Hda [Gammaproteobacteria bacterium]|nr:DnaA regulatory inactivator Hda [Gammaproteobacteria bacterium]